jgi:hypothetical protein
MKKLRTLQTVTLSLVTAASMACATSNSTSPQTRLPEPSDINTQAPNQPETVTGGQRGTIPVGQELDVRLRQRLSSDNAQVEQRFETTTVVDLMQDGRVLVPAGTVIEGFVSDVDKAGRIDRDGSLTLAFDRMRVRGRALDIRAGTTEVFESAGIRGEAGTAGIGAGVGGVVGGIIGGVKGAIIGAAIGAGGAIAATDGKDVTLPAGTIVRIRMDTPLRLG